MKVKLLPLPLLIVSCIAIMVWFVYPSYTNGVDGVKEQRQILATEKKKKTEAQEKAGNVSRMMAQLESNKTDQATVMNFVPENLKEEEIIDNLNFIASNEGLSVVELSVKPRIIMTQSDTVDVQGNPIVDANQIQSATVKPKEYDVDFSVVGNYEKIKNVFEKIYKLGRYNVVESLEIKKQETQESQGKKNEPSDNLVANAHLKFNIVRKSDRVVNINDAVFSETGFNFEVAQMIKNKKNIEILKMSIDQSGRNNPFLP